MTNQLKAIEQYSPYYALQGRSNFWTYRQNPGVWPFKWAKEQYFPVVLFIILYEVVLTLESVDEILKCDHSNERYWAVYSFQWGRAIYYAVQDDIMTSWVFGPNPEVMKLLLSAY